jgi:hypothetical protein
MMHTPLDEFVPKCYQSVLEHLSYNGEVLSVEIAFFIASKKFNPYQLTMTEFSRHKITFLRTVAFLMVEEFHVHIADLIKGTDKGAIMLEIDNPDLAHALGLDVTVHCPELKGFAILPTNNDKLIVYTEERPVFELLK